MSRLARLFCLATGLAAAAVGSAPALAQGFPSHPVTLVVTFTPGGAADVTARVFSEKLAALWHQSVVVENRPGAGGSIGAQDVLRAPADGYTLLLATNTHVINQVVYPKLKFDFTKDFAPLGLVTSSPMMLVVNPKLPAKDMKEFTALLKAHPGKYEIASCNVGSPHHFALEMYKHAMGIDALHVPYRGCTPAVTDVMAGQVQAAAVSAPAAIAFTNNGRLRALGLFSSARSDSAPGVPTIRESGIPELKDFSLDNYYGFMAPPGTPPAVQKKIETDVRTVAAMPEVQKKLKEAGIDMMVMNPADMMKLIRSDYAKYAEVAKEAHIEAE